MTEIIIKIVTEQSVEVAEEQLRNSIREIGYDIADMSFEEFTMETEWYNPE